MPAEFKAIAEGFQLVSTVRPYLTRDGSVSVRLVLRGKNPLPDTMVIHWTLRGALGEELLGVLAAAIGPKMRVCLAGDDARA